MGELTMAEVLAEHHPEGRSYGTRCGGCYPAEGSTFRADPDDPDDGEDGPVKAFYAHQAEALESAGFGDVRAAKAEAIRVEQAESRIIDILEAERDALRAQRDAVLALHVKADGSAGYVGGCGLCDCVYFRMPGVNFAVRIQTDSKEV